MDENSFRVEGPQLAFVRSGGRGTEKPSVSMLARYGIDSIAVEEALARNLAVFDHDLALRVGGQAENPRFHQSVALVPVPPRGS
jgi:hypothetical protein